MRKKKVAIIHQSLVMGGAEKALINMLHFFDFSTYEVTLWLKSEGGELLPELDPRVTVKFWGDYILQDYAAFLRELIKRGQLVSALYSVTCRLFSKLFIKNWYQNYKWYLRSFLYIDYVKYDVMISYNSYVQEDLMVMLSSFRSRKRIGWIHGEYRHISKTAYYYNFKKLYEQIDSIFCVSKAVRQSFLRAYPALWDKTDVLYNLQNIKLIKKLAEEEVEHSFDQLTIVTVGRLSREKGQDMIPAIAEKLYSDGYNFVWYIIGDGYLREKLERMIKNRRLENIVLLLGMKTNPYPYIKNCTVYVQPSYTEGFCVTTQEAIILNKLIVTTDVPGMREQFNGTEAILCSPTTESLCQGIEKAFSTPDSFGINRVSVSDEYNNRELQKLYDRISQ